MTSFPERFHTFTQSRLRHPDTYTFNVLNGGLNIWNRYYNFLHVIRTRHHEISRPYVESLERQHKAIQPAFPF